MSDWIYHHKVDQMIRAAIADTTLLDQNGIKFDCEGICTISRDQAKGFAEDVCNDLVSQLEKSNAITVLNSQ